jgi:enoyl-CoA hydratase/carnithine racemase
MTQPILISQDGGVVTLTLNRPEVMNTITDADMVTAIVDAMTAIDADQSVRCAIITGAGKAFSSGGNLRHMAEKSGIFGGDAIAVKDAYKRGIQRLARAVWQCEVPLIAAVNGAAYGAGCDLTMMCDIRIASEKAIFAENFVRVGIVPGDGGAWLLPRQIGLGRAAEMTFTAEPVRAEQALAWGLVSQVVAPDDLMETARDLAARISKNPPRQLRMSKKLMRDGLNMSLDTVLELSAAYQGAAHQTRDHIEAVSSLLERREPDFDGT